MSFENAMGKGEIACNEQFLLFQPSFLPVLENFPPISSNVKLLSANSFKAWSDRQTDLLRRENGQNAEFDYPVTKSISSDARDSSDRFVSV